MEKFKTGTVYGSDEVTDLLCIDDNFGKFVNESFDRHINGDWGDLCDEDKTANDDALEHGGRLMSAYNCPDYPDGKIWIITEADRSCTTVLFPHEY